MHSIVYLVKTLAEKIVICEKSISQGLYNHKYMWDFFIYEMTCSNITA